MDAWTVGEALINKTAVVPNLMINGDDWDKYYATPGTSDSDESYDGDMKLSSVTDVPRVPAYLDLAAADEGLVNERAMDMSVYLNGDKVKQQ